MTELRLIEMVLKRVLSRPGDSSTHRPTAEEKHIDASVLTIPLKDTTINTIHSGDQRAMRGEQRDSSVYHVIIFKKEYLPRVQRGQTHRIEAATRASGYAAAVKMIYVLISIVSTYSDHMILTAANF